MLLCVPRTSSFILTQFFVLNLDGWYDILSTLSYYCIYLSSSIICIFFSGNLYLSFGISIDFFSFWEQSWIFCEFIWNFVTNQIISHLCIVLSYSFGSSFESICSIFFSMIKKFLTLSTSWFFTNVFSKIEKSIPFQRYSISKFHRKMGHILFITN